MRSIGHALMMITKAGVAFGAVMLLSACGSLTQMQDSLSKFDQGSHLVAASQVTFMNGVHAVECETQFYAAAYAYSKDSRLPIDLRGTCVASKLFLNSKQIETRQKLLDAITLYADDLAALGSAGTDKTLGTNAQTLAINLNKLAGHADLSHSDASIGRDVETAIVGLTTMILDEKKHQSVRTAAQGQKENLSLIVAAIKAENLSLASGVDDVIGSIRADLAATLAATRNKEGAAVLFDVVRARGYLQAVSPFGSKGPDDSAGEVSPEIDPSVAIKQLNAALDGLVTANDAIASVGSGGISSAVTTLMARAQTAQAFQAAISK